MDIYTLKFPDEGNAGALRLEFGAEDAADALLTAHRKAADLMSGRAAELWQGTRRLCAIRRGETGGGELRGSARFQLA